MDASERRAYEEVLDATGDDAVEVVAKSDGPARELVADGGVDVDFRESIARAADSDAIDSFDQLDRAVRRFDELDGDYSNTFRRLADDETVSDSWLRVAGSADIDTSDIRKAVDRVEEIEDSVRIRRFETSSNVNDMDRYSGMEDPYTDGTIVMDVKTERNMGFARVHGEENQARAWMLRNRDEIEGLSPTEIKKKYSLPNKPSYVSDVDVPDGSSVRVGDTAANFGGKEGATQYELLERISAERFTNRQELPV